MRPRPRSGRSTSTTTHPAVTLDDPGAAIGASVNLTASSSADTADVTFRYRPVGSSAARYGHWLGRHGSFRRHLVHRSRRRAAVGADRRRDRRRRQRLDERPACRPRRPHPADWLRHSSGYRLHRRRLRRRSQATAADTAGSGVTLVEWQVKHFGAGTFTPSRATPARRTPSAGTRPRSPDGATDIRAADHRCGRQRAHDRHRPGHGRLDRPDCHAHRPGRSPLRQVSLTATTGGTAVRVPFAVCPPVPPPGPRSRADTCAPFDTLARHEHHRRRPLRPARDRLRLARQCLFRRPIAPDVRFDNIAPQLVSSAPADGSVSDYGQPDRADRQ